MPRARGLLCRVDPNGLDLLKCYHSLTASLYEKSIGCLLLVARDLLEELNLGRCTLSTWLGQEWRRPGPERERLIPAMTRIVRACEMVLQLTEGHGIDVVYKKQSHAFSQAPFEASRGFRKLHCAVETKGDRRYLAKDCHENGIRGLNVEKENHLVLIATEEADMEAMSKFPLAGIVEQLKRKHHATHDQLYCQACDYLGRHCGASRSRAIARSFVKGGTLYLKGLPALADEAFVNTVIREAERAVRAVDGTMGLRWQIQRVEDAWRAGEKVAVVKFFHGEICSQFCDKAKHILKEKLKAAENAVPGARLETGPGLLYAADLFLQGGSIQDILSASDVLQVVARPGSECLGWYSTHDRRDLPSIRLISAPHWLQRAMNSLPGAWQLCRLTLPYQVFQLLDMSFRPDLAEGWVEDIHGAMHTRRITSVEAPANLFEQTAHGLHRMGIFPHFSGTPYKNEEFYKELEDQQTTLLRHVHLFGKPTSAIRGRTAVHAWVELDRVSDLGVEDDRRGDEIDFEFSSEEETGESTSATGHSAPGSPGTPQTLPFPEMPEAVQQNGKVYAKVVHNFDAAQEGYDRDTVDVYLSLRRGDWVFWSEEDPELDGGWRKVWAKSEAAEGSCEGWFPDNHLQVADLSQQSISLQAEVASEWFARSYWLADGGTCDVYGVQLPSGRVAAKVLRSQESQLLVNAMHNDSALFHQEVETLQRLSHPNVVKFLGSGETRDSHFIIIQEFVSPDNLLQILPNAAFSWNMRLNAATQLSEAIRYIHSLDVIHRDIKPANVLVSFEHTAGLTALKLSDFGLAKGAQDRAMRRSMSSTRRVCGSPGYLDPDSLRGGGSTKESDIFSFAIVLLDLMIGTGCGEEADHYRSARRNRVVFHEAWSPTPGPAKTALLELVFFLRVFWRNIDRSSEMVWSLHVYLMIGWAYWLLGATHELTKWCSMPSYIQSVALALHRLNCACLEFAFTYSIQKRLKVTERGIGVELGAKQVRQIRWSFFVLQIAIDFVRIYGQTQTTMVTQVLSSVYHVVAGAGVLMTLVVAVRAFRRVKRALKEVSVREESYASAERDWCLRVLNRMIMAVCFSCILSAASHILCLPAIFLAPEEWRQLIVPGYHFMDVTAELIGLVFIVGILKPPEKVSFAEQSVPRLRAMRGMSRLTEELPTTEENDKVQELALRSINLSELLDFYESLGCEGSRMPHFDPCRSTTHDVVRQAIIPASRQGSGGMSYAELLQQTGHVANRMPDCMVTHSWSNLFLDLVAAVVADALGHDEYDKVAHCLRQGHVETLRQQLLTKGTLGNSYWICCFCVNQHSSICAGPGPAPTEAAARVRWERNCRDTVTGEPLTFCDCLEPKLANDDADCEVNKFDAMMLWLQYKNPRLRQLVAVDRKFDVFSRSWCIAELVAAHGADIPQSVCLETSKPFDPTAEDLAIYEYLVNLSVANSLASRPEDKEMILQKVSSVREFDAALQMLIFGNRGLLTKKLTGFDLLEPAARFTRRLCKVRSIEI
ncbi:LRK10L-1.1 [Symbiodinium sp. CCMP2592]|nr:LRK10L-1.1 [Symbiodinium sp. CCMP2592]